MKIFYQSFLQAPFSPVLCFWLVGRGNEFTVGHAPFAQWVWVVVWCWTVPSHVRGGDTAVSSDGFSVSCSSTSLFACKRRFLFRLLMCGVFGAQLRRSLAWGIVIPLFPIHGWQLHSPSPISQAWPHSHAPLATCIVGSMADSWAGEPVERLTSPLSLTHRWGPKSGREVST